MKTIKLLFSLVVLSFILYACSEEENHTTLNDGIVNIEKRTDCSGQIVGPNQFCASESAVFCYKSMFTPNNVTWSGIPSINGASSSCVSVSDLEAGVYNISVTLDFGGCQTTESHSFTVCEQAFTHPNPPYEFTQICSNAPPVCFDFGSDPCITAMLVSSDNPAVAIEAIGTNVCITALTGSAVEVEFTTQALGVCEDGNIETWTIIINGSSECGPGDPVNDPPFVDPWAGDGYCDSNFDCPPGQICVFGKCI